MPLLSDSEVCSLEVLKFKLLFFVLGWQLQEEVDGLADRVELANNALRGDWSRWLSSMRTDLRSAFVSSAEKNVEYYEKVRASWLWVLFGDWELLPRLYGL